MANSVKERATSAEASILPPDSTLFKQMKLLCQYLRVEEDGDVLRLRIVDPRKRTVVIEAGGRIRFQAPGVSMPRSQKG